MSHFERVIREFAVDIEYVINEFDKYRYVSNHRFLRLQRRVSLLEGPSTDIIQNDKTINTVVHNTIKKGDVKPDEILVHTRDNSRNVLLKSPETVNDDSWVHVDNVINDA